MAHPLLHAKSSVKKFGGKVEDYIHLHNWMDETKAWVGHSYHRMFRHHSEGIFENDKVTHDEFFDKTPFPIKRDPGRFVGERMDEHDKPVGEDYKIFL